MGSAGDVYLTNSLIADEGCTGNTIHPVFPNIDIDGTCGGLTVPIGAIELGPLSDNGGDTLTHALGAGSVAIDLVVRHVCRPTNEDKHALQDPNATSDRMNTPAWSHRRSAAPKHPRWYSTDTPPPQVCTFTAGKNLFCQVWSRCIGLPVADSRVGTERAGHRAERDGKFLYVVGPNNGLTCAVPSAESFGTTRGDCKELFVFTPVPPPITPTTEKQADDLSPSACYVRRPSGALNCVSPCPAGAIPGTACTPMRRSDQATSCEKELSVPAPPAGYIHFAFAAVVCAGSRSTPLFDT